MSQKHAIRLSGAVKIDAKWHQAGDQIEVDDDTLQQLRAALVVDEAPAEDTHPAASRDTVEMTRDEFERKVAATAKAVAELMVAAAVEAAVSELVAERDAAVAKAAEAEKTVASLREQLAASSAEVGVAAKKTASKAASKG